MFKQITLCLILASAMNCIFLEKINASKAACKRANELEADIKKLDHDKKTYENSTHKEIHELKEKIEELKRKITAKEADLKKYVEVYEKNKCTKEEELKKQEKICKHKKVLEHQLGSARTLHEDESECSDSDKSAHKKYHKKDHKNSDKSSKSDDSKKSKHDNENHNGHYNAWAKNEHTNAKIDAKASGQSFGKGESTAVAGPNGSQTTAHGTLGAKTGSSFQADIQKKGSNWGVDNSKGNKSSWGTTFANDSKVDARGSAQGFGNASVGSRTGFEGSENFAKGTKGTTTGASWKGNNDSKENSWGVNHKF